MKQTSFAICLALAVLSSGGTMAFAQSSPPAAPPKQEDNVRTRTVKEILRRIEEGAGSDVRIVADSTVLNERAPLPTDATTNANFEAQLDTLVQKLPEGTTWAKLYLPAPEATRNYKGDDLAEFALAQSKLFGKIGAAPAGTVEVMGKIMPTDKAQAIVEALNLKPVYLITNPLAKSASAGNNNAWAQMTDEQKKDFAKSEAQKLLNLGPEAFGQAFGNLFGQQAAIMGQMFGMMSPEQRDQYRQAMVGQMMKGGGGANVMFMQRSGNGQP